MLVATIITYNDWPLIKECVESVIGKVDKIICIDGRFADFPGDSNFSTDGTLKYLKDKVSVTLIGGLDEVEKRNIYLDQLKDGDICLNLDTDEILVGEIPQLEADTGIIQIGEQGDRRRHRRTNRFFRYKDGLHYWGTHKMILDKGKLFANLDRVGEGYTSQKVTEFELLHRNDLRSADRKKDKKKYYKILMVREAKINVPAN